MLRRDPRLLGHRQARWTLQALLQSCPWLHLGTLGGISQLLKRLGISYKRGREQIHSPDQDYGDKVALLAKCLLRAWYDPERYCLVYQDELPYYRQPTLARAYEAVGPFQARAPRSYRSNTAFRVASAMNAVTGQVTWLQSSKVGIDALVHLYTDIRSQYPHAEVIYLVQDNWPVHFHPDVLAALQPQTCPWPWHVPSNWPLEPSPKALQLNLPIQIVPLPTYAPWLNAIEKLWRWLKQVVLHMHRLSDDWPALRQEVADFLSQFASGSMPLHDALIDLDIDVLIGPDPVQGQGTDLQRMGEQLRGRICTWGGVNSFITVERGTREGIDIAVREAIEALGPEGFILSPVDNVTDPSDAVWENVLALIESWKKYR